MGANVDLPSLLKSIPFFYALTAVQLNRLAEIIDYIPDSTSNKFCHHFHPGGVMVVVERA